jgi:hypothetical protein
MAAQFSSFFTATIYGQSAVYDGVNGGWSFPSLFRSPSYQAFPKSGLKIYTVSPASVQTNNGVSVTINSIIEIFPSGVLGALAPQRLASDSTFAQLYAQGA